MRYYWLILLLVLFIQCQRNEKKDFNYYSFEKSCQNNTFGYFDDGLNFYKFQNYYQSICVDSVLLNYYHHNFEDSLIYNFLLRKYEERGYDHSIEILSHIDKYNSENVGDTGIIVLDINDSISLVSLSPDLSIYALGNCCSPYQNLLVKKVKDKVVVFDELNRGRLLGVYLSRLNKINGFLFQGFSNQYSDFERFSGMYNYRYNVNEYGIIFDKIINVRNGEPFDKKDQLISDDGLMEVKNISFKSR